LAVRIRLTRTGATKRPSYRVVAIDRRRSRDGRALEILGYYDPLTDPATVQLDEARIRDWLAKGAQPSEVVVKLMRQAGMAEAGAPAATGTAAVRTRAGGGAPKARAPKRQPKDRPEGEAPAAESAGPATGESGDGEPA
jgi:small subunit ribosomal protein S16